MRRVNGCEIWGTGACLPRGSDGAGLAMSRRPGSTDTRGDPGYFGPGSVSWRVHREAAVMLGGARALLMHAAHPLVVAGARPTQMYTRDPWARLERTLRLNNMVTFGSKAQADATASCGATISSFGSTLVWSTPPC